MAGKRPDQYAGDPADEGPSERVADEHLVEEAKQQMHEHERRPKQEGKIPVHGENPALKELKAARAARERGD